MGLLTRVIRAKGDATSERATDYLYDGLGRLRKEKQYGDWPTTGTGVLQTDFTYDQSGNLTLLKEPKGQTTGHTTTYTYDLLNRLTAINYADSTPDVAYTYDLHGSRTQMTSGTPDVTSTYNVLDRLVTTVTGQTVGYRYDLDGNRRTLLYPGSTGSVTYAFDKASLPDWASRQTTYTYLDDGSLKDVTYPNGMKGTYAYDNALRLTEIHHQTTGGTPSTITRHTNTLDTVGTAPP